eukprot:scaffold237227_cov47-Prasinocladus_malaysianus.AAC.2
MAAIELVISIIRDTFPCHELDCFDAAHDLGEEPDALVTAGHDAALVAEDRRHAQRIGGRHEGHHSQAHEGREANLLMKQIEAGGELEWGRPQLVHRRHGPGQVVHINVEQTRNLSTASRCQLVRMQLHCLLASQAMPTAS